MAYPDKINALVDVSADETLAAGGHAARHNDVNEALDELEAVFTAPAANELALRPDGTNERVRITSAGNVGIGTTNPSTGKLVVQGGVVSGAVAAHIRGGDGGATRSLVVDGDAEASDDLIRVRSASDANPTDSDTKFLINGSGAVLIGTTTPGSAGAGDLVVNGGVFLGGNAAANELDDYEEGTWTPEYEPASGAFGSITHDVQLGVYIKIGNLVYGFGRIRTDAITVGTASGSIKISGLPFTTASVSGFNFPTAHIGNALNFTNGPTAGTIPASDTRLNLQKRTSTTASFVNLDVADMATGANDNEIQFSFCYKAA